jgi:hypothetical protein
MSMRRSGKTGGLGLGILNGARDCPSPFVSAAIERSTGRTLERRGWSFAFALRAKPALMS